MSRSDFTDDALAHYGVKGMRWGVRKDGKPGSSRGTDVVVTQKKAGTFAKAKGGKGQALVEDAEKSLASRQKARASTTDALSNKELRVAIERMQLEQQFKRLEFESDRRSKGARFVAGLLGNKRYNGEKLKYKDLYEEAGGSVRDIYRTRTA